MLAALQAPRCTFSKGLEATLNRTKGITIASLHNVFRLQLSREYVLCEDRPCVAVTLYSSWPCQTCVLLDASVSDERCCNSPVNKRASLGVHIDIVIILCTSDFQKRLKELMKLNLAIDHTQSDHPHLQYAKCIFLSL